MLYGSKFSFRAMYRLLHGRSKKVEWRVTYLIENLIILHSTDPVECEDWIS